MYLLSELVFWASAVGVWFFCISSIVLMFDRQKRRRHKMIRRLPL